MSEKNIKITTQEESSSSVDATFQIKYKGVLDESTIIDIQKALIMKVGNRDVDTLQKVIHSEGITTFICEFMPIDYDNCDPETGQPYLLDPYVEIASTSKKIEKIIADPLKGNSIKSVLVESSEMEENEFRQKFKVNTMTSRMP